MGKNQSASNLTNIIQYNNGNISFVSGSTTLMQISASGAITTTGVISGSNALSASYALNSTSASYAINATSTSFAVQAQTASSADSLTVRGTLTAQTLVVQTITSSVSTITGSTNFGSLLANTHTFTGSIITSGSIGINTTPDNTYQGLTIAGSNPSLRLKGTQANAWTWVEFVSSSGTNNFSMGVNHTSPYFGIKIGAGMDGTNFTMLSNGNVGIGTTSPGYKLHVFTTGTGGFTVQAANANVGAPILDFYDTGRAQETVISSTDNTTVGTYIASYSNHPLMFGSYANSTPTAKMTILQNGNVGIGLASPSFNLDVTGSIRVIHNTSGGTAEFRAIGSGYGGTYYSSLRSISGAVGVLQLGNNADNYIIGGNGGAGGGYLIFRVNASAESISSGREAMRIASTGNVGINDTSPSTTLSVNGANYVEMATFACTSAAASTIVTNNTGYVQFSLANARHCSNSSLFVPTTDGIQITKAGIVHVQFSQDITTSGSTGYVSGYIQKNKTNISENLITNTNGQWDGLTGCATIDVAANDVINFSINAADITSFDANSWSQYSFLWTSR